MNLRDKLKLIDSFPQRTVEQSVRTKEKVDLKQFFDGDYEMTPHGPCFIVTRRYDTDFLHGNIRLGEFVHIDPEIWSFVGKDEKLAQMEPEKILFFDTETTGLSSGVGTYIFLIGFGYFAGTEFVIKQYLLRDYDEEMAFLYSINRLFENFNGLVSYNGKSFDWHLIESRFVYSKLKLSIEQPLHLDLVHTSRRIWRDRLGDCSLGNIERHVLDFHRVGDIPGFQIPAIFFQYLRDKNVTPLVPILRHNEWDILSLAALLIYASRIFVDPIQFMKHNTDLVSVARVFENMRRWDLGVSIYEYLLENECLKSEKKNIAKNLGSCLKKMERWEEAAEVWEKVISSGQFEPDTYVELAKYYEHRKQQYHKAIEYVSRAIASLQIAEELGRSAEINRLKDELQHRLRRNQEKLTKGERGV